MLVLYDVRPVTVNGKISSEKLFVVAIIVSVVDTCASDGGRAFSSNTEPKTSMVKTIALHNISRKSPTGLQIINLFIGVGWHNASRCVIF